MHFLFFISVYNSSALFLRFHSLRFISQVSKDCFTNSVQIKSTTFHMWTLNDAHIIARKMSKIKLSLKGPNSVARLLFISLRVFIISTSSRRKKNCAKGENNIKKTDNDRGELNAQRRECNWKFLSSMVSERKRENCVIEAKCEVADKSKKIQKSQFIWNEILKLNCAQLPQLILRSAKWELFLLWLPKKKKSFQSSVKCIQSTVFLSQLTFPKSDERIEMK